MMPKVLFLVLFLFFFVFNAGFGFPFFSPKTSPIINFSTADCSGYQRVEDKIFLDPVCVLNWRLPNFSLKDRADIVWTRILSFSKGYDSQTETILYRPAEIALSKADNLYPLTEKRRQQLVLAHQKGKKIWFPLAVNLERSPCQLVIVKSRSRSLMSSSQDFCGSVVFKAKKRASLYWERFWLLITGKIFLWLEVFGVFEPVFFAIKIAVYK